ncbi:MAG: type III secretion system chaperone [Pseudomonadota bacterium]
MSDHAFENSDSNTASRHLAMARDHLQPLLGEIAARLSLDELAFDANDHCAIQIDDDVIVELFLEPDRASLVLASEIGAVGSRKRDEIVRGLLISNFMWYSTRGGTLGLGDADDVLLHRELPVESRLDANALMNALSEFALLTENWRDALDSARTPDDQPRRDHANPLPDIA